MMPLLLGATLRRDWRCRKCGALLARVIVAPGSHIEIICRKCGASNVLVSDDAEAPAKA